jgi:hypothetical protein
MDYSDKLFTLLYNTFWACFDQILWLWGPLFLLGFAQWQIAKLRNAAFAGSVGTKAELYLTGWIGTPVHEMGHAIFCVLFRHKITEAKFLSPAEDGTMGYVKHEYNPKSTYQKTGNFFIGLGPMLFGTVLIYSILGLLLPECLPYEIKGGIMHTSGDFFRNFISFENFSKWRFWLFIYLSFGISSHITLSREDFKGAASGFFTLLCIIFLVNLIANMLFSFGLKSLSVSAWLVPKADVFLSLFYSIMIYALAISLLYLGFAYVLLGVAKLFRRARLIFRH